MKTKELSWTETKVKSFSCVRLLRSRGLHSPCNSPGQNTGVGLNPGLLHCRWILHQLSHQGSPRILEWVACPFLQRVFPTQELNQGLLHCRRILHQLSYQGSAPGVQVPAWAWRDLHNGRSPCWKSTLAHSQLPSSQLQHQFILKERVLGTNKWSLVWQSHPKMTPLPTLSHNLV